jgi:hypothetical protein
MWLLSPQTSPFTLCVSLYLMTGLSRGFTVRDSAGSEWLKFQYEVHKTNYELGSGFSGRYLLSK